MKFSTALVALAAPLAALAAGSRTSRINSRDDSVSVNPVNVETTPVTPYSNDGPITNAERLRRGLALKAPSRTTAAKREGSSPVPVTAYIKVIDLDNNGQQLGYVGKEYNVFGEYGLTTDAEDALPVAFSHTSNPDDTFDITLPGAPYPFLGGITGFANSDDNFASGSLNYAYLGGVTQTPSDAISSPGFAADGTTALNSFTSATGISETSQSTIFKYDPATNQITAQWYNTDGSQPETTLTYYQPDNVFVITGDRAAFGTAFGTNPHIGFVLVLA